MPRQIESLADVVVHALQAVRGNEMRVAGGGERRLVERLVVPFGVDQRFAGKRRGGMLPRDAVVSAVMICVRPGPHVTEATPTLPVAQ